MLLRRCGARSGLASCRSRITVRAMASAPQAPSLTPATNLRNAGPEAKTFAVPKGQLLNVATAAFGVVARLGSGGLAHGYSVSLDADSPDDPTYAVASFAGRKVRETSAVASLPRPTLPLELYDLHGCPFCRKVREAISILDLDVLVKPCPRNGPTWRPEAVALGGKAQFPLLVDPNNATAPPLYESDAIIEYLFEKYGPGKEAIPRALRLGVLTTLTAGLALAPRVGAGSRYTPARQPAEPLYLWAYELSPFVTLVKEVLGELELPYYQVTVSRGSPKRQALQDARGQFQVPYLEDRNEGAYLFESDAIIAYLRATYGGASGASVGVSGGERVQDAAAAVAERP